MEARIVFILWMMIQELEVSQRQEEQNWFQPPIGRPAQKTFIFVDRQTKEENSHQSLCMEELDWKHMRLKIEINLIQDRSQTKEKLQSIKLTPKTRPENL